MRLLKISLCYGAMTCGSAVPRVVAGSAAAAGGGTTVGRCTSSWRVMRNRRPGAQDRGGGERRRSHGVTRHGAPRPSREAGGRGVGGAGRDGHGRGGAGACKKMARTCFTDILNAFISGVDRAAGQGRRAAGGGWWAGGWGVVRFHTNPHLCLIPLLYGNL